MSFFWLLYLLLLFFSVLDFDFTIFTFWFSIKYLGNKNWEVLLIGHIGKLCSLHPAHIFYRFYSVCVYIYIYIYIYTHQRAQYIKKDNARASAVFKCILLSFCVIFIRHVYENTVNSQKLDP